MTRIVNRERLGKTFTELCEIDSPSRREGRIAAHLKEIFAALGADSIYEDGSAEMTGSEVGNLIVRFNGNLPEQDGIYFSCHMDTVEPGEGVKVQRTGDIFTSKGDTILGGDDKTGIAAVIELLTLLKENNTPHPMIEFVITTCEEIGLRGAKHLEYDKIRATYGYALDSTGIDHVVIGAPAANKLKVEIRGLAAHAGLCPEAGINALALAAKALSKIKMGRLDDESTCNFGLIQGGTAANIIPDLITLRGEVRSHSEEKLSQYTREIYDTFDRTIGEWQGSPLLNGEKPSVAIDIVADYPVLSIDENHPVVERVKRGAAVAGKQLRYIVAGGGSDANILNSRGLPTVIIATGMDKVHTVDEQLDLNDLTSLTELLYGLIVAGD
ncbi:MAG: M20/M25/M40 family metallo-hydrolase [Desulforhopalus sp.]